MEIRNEFKVTAKYLRENPNYIFVFGDNRGREGYAGAAALRDEPNTYGFITVKNLYSAEPSYTPANYISDYLTEITILRHKIINNPDKIFLISKVGAGIANKYGIWEEVIEPTLPIFLMDLENVVLLWS